MRDLLSNIIRRQKAELAATQLNPSVARSQSSELFQALPSSLIKVVLGPRRAGKSTLVRQALEGKKFAYLNFEDEQLPSIDNGDIILDALRDVYGDIDFYFFDEVQLFPRWEQFANRLHRNGLNLILTGSNAKMLSDELASSLTGRHIALELFPFSYQEMAKQFGHTSETQKQYLLSGGFPEVALRKVDSNSYLSTLWEAIILKDIVQRKKVRQVSALRDLLSLVLNNLCSKYSAESLAKSLVHEISPPTVRKFLAYSREAYLVFELQPFHLKPRLRLKSPKKSYIADNGFYTAKHVAHSQEQGKLLENLVFVELLRRGSTPNLDLFYYQSNAGYELDFLVRKNGKNSSCIQVCHSLLSQETKRREIRALLAAAQELDVSDLTILTMNEIGEETINGRKIHIMPIFDWCYL